MLYSTTIDESFVLSETKTKYKTVLFMYVSPLIHH